MIELLSVAKYVNDTLTNDPTLISLFPNNKPLVYSEGAPHGAGLGPYIVFNVPPGPDSNTLDGNRFLVPGDVNISVCIQDKGYGAILDIANRIDKLMVSLTQVIVMNVFITKFVRKATIMMSDDTNDVFWYYLGGIYSVDVFEYGVPFPNGINDTTIDQVNPPGIDAGTFG